MVSKKTEIQWDNARPEEEAAPNCQYSDAITIVTRDARLERIIGLLRSRLLLTLAGPGVNIKL
jgi:hypothetical protein